MSAAPIRSDVVFHRDGQRELVAVGVLAFML